MKKIDKKVFDRWIDVSGARVHNLKNINVSIPKDTLTVITGPSGSGKSSLAFDVLYTEGRRRYVESLSAYARQFLGASSKPEVDKINGLCPAVAIEQKTVSHNPRSTVGTVTEIYDYLRVLFARVGTPNCPKCNKVITSESAQSIAQRIIIGHNEQIIMIVAPIAKQQKGEFVRKMSALFEQGFTRFIINGVLHKFRLIEDVKKITLQKTKKHTIDLVVDRCLVGDKDASRVQEAVEKASIQAGGLCKVVAQNNETLYSMHQSCVTCGIAVPDLEPRLFSFNSPVGACKNCLGIGTCTIFDEDIDPWEIFCAYSRGEVQRICGCCNGNRLNPIALAVCIDNKAIYELTAMPIKELHAFFTNLSIDDHKQEIARDVVIEICNRLTFLINVGLSYLTLNRTAGTLSGGEGQRIRLAKQIGSGLSGVLYVLDEPSIGLHQRDNYQLIETLKKLRDQGNTIVVVEHDHDTMHNADYLIDMGPAAGVRGGQVTAHGTVKQVIKDQNSLTGSYLSGHRGIKLNENIRKKNGELVLRNAKKNNLQNINVTIPLGVMSGISGVSGSGKSSLIMHELVTGVDNKLKRLPQAKVGPKVSGIDNLRNMVVVDQSPIGRTSRSNSATYLKIFDQIRSLYASLPESNIRGYKVGRFSFNVAEGRCKKCKGDGVITVEMHFLPSVTVVCKECNGQRYDKQTLQITYKGKNIADVLAMTAYEALDFFKNHQKLYKSLQLMCDVGLDYIALGQSSTTLSGGEAQRIKLVHELAKRGNGTLYVLDEPTTGLHTNDVERLLYVLNRLVDQGNTMIIIEHNLDVLKTVDYLIDLGPEGGDGGGTIIASGTPQEVSACKDSHTGRYLRQYF
jgi:excinuclease ABC subunit A